MTETFRLAKWVKYQGMSFAVLFLAAVLGYLSNFSLKDPAEHGFKGEHSVVIVGGMGLAVFGTMLLMSIYIWASYHVERFTINGNTLSIRSMLQNRQFDLSELNRLKWMVRPAGGSIRFELSSSKARLDLFGYAKDDRLRLVVALHDLVPPQLQEGWPMFCQKVTLPLREGKLPAVTGEQSSD